MRLIISLVLLVGAVESGLFGGRRTSAKLLFFYGSTLSDHQAYDLQRPASDTYNGLIDLMKHPKFNTSRLTVLFIHGYVESGTTDSSLVIADAYLTRSDHNLIVLDWHEEASGNYFIHAVPNAVKIGEILGDAILNAFQHGVDKEFEEKFYIVSHSLGAQMAGGVGRQVLKQSKKQKIISRICGLDPAGPAFRGIMSIKHLSKDAAKFVDIIHTDAGSLLTYGHDSSSGHCDFWPNSGKRFQPGCPWRIHPPDDALCNHRRSFVFFAESVKSPKQTSFLAVSAKDWDAFKKGDIDEKKIVNMGIHCTTHARGDYYLQTTRASPFSRDAQGIHFDKTFDVE